MNIYGDNISMQSWILCLLTLTALTSGQTITSPPDSATGVAGDDVSFSCKVEFGPIKAMAWEFNKIIIYSLQDTQEHYPSGMDKYSVTNDEGIFTLWISKLDFTDGGIYTCTTMIPTASATLIVLGKPELSTPTRSPVEGSTGAYTCTAEFAGPPEEHIEHYPSIQMLLDGVPQDATTKKENCEHSTNCYKLTQIHNIELKADMNGKIMTCDIGISNLQVHERSSVDVTVLYSVRDIKYMPEQDQHEVGTKLSCLADGNPDPQFVWDDRNAENSVDGQILPITEPMLGSNIWTCTAKNVIGEVVHDKSVVAVFSVVLPRDSEGSDSWKIGVGVTIALFLLVTAIGTFMYKRGKIHLPLHNKGGVDDSQDPQTTDPLISNTTLGHDSAKGDQKVSKSENSKLDQRHQNHNTTATDANELSPQTIAPTHTVLAEDEHVGEKASVPKVHGQNTTATHLSDKGLNTDHYSKTTGPLISSPTLDNNSAEVYQNIKQNALIPEDRKCMHPELNDKDDDYKTTRHANKDNQSGKPLKIQTTDAEVRDCTQTKDSVIRVGGSNTRNNNTDADGHKAFMTKNPDIQGIKPKTAECSLDHSDKKAEPQSLHLPVKADNKSTKENAFHFKNSPDSSPKLSTPHENKRTTVEEVNNDTGHSVSVKDQTSKMQSPQGPVFHTKYRTPDGASDANVVNTKTETKGSIKTGYTKGNMNGIQGRQTKDPQELQSKNAQSTIQNQDDVDSKQGHQTKDPRELQSRNVQSTIRNQDDVDSKSYQGVGAHNDLETKATGTDLNKIFHGILPREWREYLLKNEGDYLITECQDGSGQFELTIRTEEKIEHFSLKYEQGNWTLHTNKKYQYWTIYELVSKLPFLTNVPETRLRGILREKWELNTSDVILEDSQKTSGTFGEILKGKHNRRQVAVKICRKPVTDYQRKAFFNDGHYLMLFSHINIIGFIGITITENPFVMVLENGDLLTRHLQIDQHKVRLYQLIMLCQDVSNGMEYLKAQCCIHRDLAAQNCLVSEDNRVKIANFHMARGGEKYKDDQSDYHLLKWPAPEACKSGTYTFSSDVWSFGVLMLEIFSYGSELYKEISAEDGQHIRAGNVLPAPMETPRDMYELMKDCWKKQHEARPSIKKIQSRIKAAFKKNDDKILKTVTNS